MSAPGRQIVSIPFWSTWKIGIPGCKHICQKTSWWGHLPISRCPHQQVLSPSISSSKHVGDSVPGQEHIMGTLANLHHAESITVGRPPFPLIHSLLHKPQGDWAAGISDGLHPNADLMHTKESRTLSCSRTPAPLPWSSWNITMKHILGQIAEVGWETWGFHQNYSVGKERLIDWLG